MLLNQCLAISLSHASNANDTNTNTTSNHKRKAPQSKTRAGDGGGGHPDEKNANDGRPTSNQIKTTTYEINQWSASCLFKQLVEQNSLGTATTSGSQTQAGATSFKLNEVLKRVEFAGFVMPSWLLLSGTYDDLHSIKSSWASGQLRAPADLRIETIGNIRSVNVDYFGEPRAEAQAQSEMKLDSVHHQQANSTTELPMTRLGGSSSSLEQKILSSINWLTRGRHHQIQQLQQQQQQDKVSLIQLVEFINSKWPQQPVTSETTERTTRALMQNGLLIGVQQTPAAEQHSNHSNYSNLSPDWFSLPASSSEHLESKSPPPNATVELTTTTSCSASSSSSSAKSARSKSTTLDSGLGGQQACSWDSSTTTSADEMLESCSAHELLGEPSGQLAIIEKSPQSSSAILSKPRVGQPVSGRCRGASADKTNDRSIGALERAKEQVVAVVGQEQAAAAVTSKRRRGFSLTRSLSFKVYQQQQSNRQPPSTSGNNHNNSPQGGGQGETSSTSDRQEGPSSASKHSHANLSSLFRSKSMRVVSMTRRKTLTTNFDCDNDDDENDYDRRADIMPIRARPRTSGQQQQQATIDYLTEATQRKHYTNNNNYHNHHHNHHHQHHKRSFSMRRNSILAFGKEELGGGAGKIAMFLRRLFSLGRNARRPHGDLDGDGGPPTNERNLEGGRILVDIRHNCHEQDCVPMSPENGLPECACQRQTRTNSAMTNNNNNNNSNKCPPRYQDFVPASPPSYREGTVHGDEDDHSAGPSSPSQNSLIEILDCSRSMEKSRRDLRQEEARSSSASRATWRLIKRSGSSLSQASNASCSTNKSTVSQQLRRHLDEAYKRHRKCTSKREKDFIDSINVLRQASRYASLQNSRSSSKNRRHHRDSCSKASSSGVAGARRSRGSQHTASDADSNSSRLDSITSPVESTASSSSAGNSRCQPRRFYDNDKSIMATDVDISHLHSVAAVSRAADLSGTVQAPGQSLKLDNANLLDGSNQHWRPALSDTNQLSNSNEDEHYCACCCLVAATTASSATHLLPSPVQHESSSKHPYATTNSSSSLCQFACCPALVANQQLAPAACCLAIQRLAPNFAAPTELAASDHQGQNQLALHTNQPRRSSGLTPPMRLEPADSSELCCPIWRSMIYSYCQQQSHGATATTTTTTTPPPLPFNGLLAPPPPFSGVDPAPYALSMPHNIITNRDHCYSNHHHHHHHHQQQLHHQLQSQCPGQCESQKLLQQLDKSFVASSTQLSSKQQQQHNTTIDLKIEIGADFKKLAKSRTVFTPRLRARQQQQQQQTSSSDDATDSLDEPHGPSEAGQDDKLVMTTDDGSNSSASSSSGATKDELRHRSRQETTMTSGMTTSCEDEHSLQSADDDSLADVKRRQQQQQLSNGYTTMFECKRDQTQQPVDGLSP